MPAWVIGFLIGMGIYTVRYEVRVHHKPAQPAAVVMLDQNSTSAAPVVLACMEGDAYGRTESN